MGGLVEGAALGAALQVLFTSVANAICRAVHFRSRLGRLQSTLSWIKLAMDDGSIADRPTLEIEAFAARLVEGERLVGKCCRVKRWNVVEMWRCAKKLDGLEASLVRFFQVDVAAVHFRESKRISAVASGLDEKLNEVTAILKRLELCGGGGNFSGELGQHQPCEEDDRKGG